MSDEILLQQVVVCGEPLEIEFEIIENESPFNITSYEARIQLRKDKLRGEVLATFVDGDSSIIRNNAGGKVVLKVSPTVTNSFTFKVAFMDLWLHNTVSGDGIRSDPVQLNLKRGVTGDD